MHFTFIFVMDEIFYANVISLYLHLIVYMLGCLIISFNGTVVNIII